MKRTNASIAINIGHRVKQYGRMGTVVHVHRNARGPHLDVLRIAWDNGRENVRCVREVTASNFVQDYVANLARVIQRQAQANAASTSPSS